MKNGYWIQKIIPNLIIFGKPVGDHVDRNLDVNIVDIRKSGAIKWWASAAAVIAIVSGVYYYNIQPSKTEQLTVVSTLPKIEKIDQNADFPTDTFHSSINPKIITHYERKPSETNQFRL